MKRLHSTFFINPLTVLYLSLGLMFNRFGFIIVHYFIAFIHELSHYLMAVSLKIKVKEIQFLPIGFFIKIENLEEEKFYKQLLILIAGPLSFFISLALIKLAYIKGFLSYYGYFDALVSNRFILIFNLLPIYPLDGSKLIELFLSPFLNEYKLRVTRSIISILSLVVISYYLVSLGEVLTMVFLFFVTILSLINLKKDYLLFLLKRLKKKNKRKVRVNKNQEIYRLYDNYYLKNNNLQNESQIIQEILKKEQLKKEIIN